MCGIAGLINIKRVFSAATMRKIVGRMADTMVHRGPDDSGVWVDPSAYCAFSHRRLSIIDTSSAGQQPMLSANGSRAITFNGEIYNYQELKNELEQRGVRFRTASDTEVLLEALAQYNKETFLKLDGMYAFAYYDSASREVIIGRDPFGEKPLYYTIQNGTLSFASELHALPCVPGFSADIDRDAIAQYFAFQYIPSPLSIYKGVYKLPPGHYLSLDAQGKISIVQYFKFSPHHEPERAQPLDALADELEDILVRSIKRRMISDVPLGAFLSGGVDSSAVVALMTQKLGRHVKTFSLGCHNSEESEHLLARQMAQHLGTEHHDLVLTPDVPKLVRMIGECLDEPNADSSCLPTYLLSQFARKQVTVLLSGDGGDEMFGGYGRYFSTVEEAKRKLEGDSSLKDWTPGSAYFSNRILIFEEHHLRELLGEIPPNSKALFEEFRAKINETTPPLLARLREVDMRMYMPGAVLPKVDRMSMQHALEVRCPILSIEVARFAEKLAPSHCYADGQGKLVLKEVAGRYIPRAWLDRKKMGFSVPIHLWGKENLFKALRDLVLSPEALLPNWIDRKNIEAFLLRQQSSFSAYQMWSVLLLEIWLRNHMLGERHISRWQRFRANPKQLVRELTTWPLPQPSEFHQGA